MLAPIESVLNDFVSSSHQVAIIELNDQLTSWSELQLETFFDAIKKFCITEKIHTVRLHINIPINLLVATALEKFIKKNATFSHLIIRCEDLDNWINFIINGLSENVRIKVLELDRKSIKNKEAQKSVAALAKHMTQPSFLKKILITGCHRGFNGEVFEEVLRTNDLVTIDTQNGDFIASSCPALNDWNTNHEAQITKVQQSIDDFYTCFEKVPAIKNQLLAIVPPAVAMLLDESIVLLSVQMSIENFITEATALTELLVESHQILLDYYEEAREDLTRKYHRNAIFVTENIIKMITCLKRDPNLETRQLNRFVRSLEEAKDKITNNDLYISSSQELVDAASKKVKPVSVELHREHLKIRQQFALNQSLITKPSPHFENALYDLATFYRYSEAPSLTFLSASPYLIQGARLTNGYCKALFDGHVGELLNRSSLPDTFDPVLANIVFCSEFGWLIISDLKKILDGIKIDFESQTETINFFSPAKTVEHFLIAAPCSENINSNACIKILREWLAQLLKEKSVNEDGPAILNKLQTITKKMLQGLHKKLDSAQKFSALDLALTNVLEMTNNAFFQYNYVPAGDLRVIYVQVIFAQLLQCSTDYPGLNKELTEKLQLKDLELFDGLLGKATELLPFLRKNGELVPLLKAVAERLDEILSKEKISRPTLELFQQYHDTVAPNQGIYTQTTSL